jgi:hypothetical protein
MKILALTHAPEVGKEAAEKGRPTSALLLKLLVEWEER